MIELLTFTSLYPSAEQPGRGVFVEQRLRHLLDSGAVRSRVVAPVPWFPLRSARFGSYSSHARVSETERRHGIAISHPRYPVIPKIGMSLAPSLMAAAVLGHVRRLLREGRDVDAIDAHYFYPDGVAAVKIGRALNKPVVITARGTDINLIPKHRLPRAQILWAARHAAGLVTVSQALKDEMIRLGIDGDRITVLRNGVDLAKFSPQGRERMKTRLMLRGPTLISVGNLIELKGHDIAIRALRELPAVHLVIVGEGALESTLRRLARDIGVGDRVRFTGGVPHDELRDYFSAADALVLASSREGMANVLLESLACGTPVVATATGGTPEIITDRSAGVLMERRDPASLVDAYRRLMDAYPTTDETRRFAERFSWEATTAGQIELFSRVTSR